MIRLVLILLLALSTAFPAKAEVRLSISYSETANLFQITDNVALWLEGFNDPRYRAEWITRFGWSDADQAWADRYAEYRRRTFSDPSQDQDVATSAHGLFPARVSIAAGTDPLADYLLDQPDVETALADLEAIMSKADARMLRRFYRHFEQKWRVLLDESAPLTSMATQLSGEMDAKEVDPFIRTISRFYGSEARGEFRVFFTRFPKGDGYSANIMSGNALLLNSPTDWTLDQGDWETIVAHEFAHYLSAQQSDAQKRALSDRFLKICPIPQGANRLWMIEEPLAVAVGQAAFSQMVLGETLDPRQNWYYVEWIDLVARTLAPSVVTAIAEGKTLEQSMIIEEAAERCRDLTRVVEQLSPRPD